MLVEPEKLTPAVLSRASMMKTVAMKEAKMSLVNLVKYLTTKEPWKQATVAAMIRHQKLIQTLQGKNSTSALLENWNRASS